MNLHHRYLPQFDFNEVHSITIHAAPSKIFAIISAVDFDSPFIIRMLLRLRGIPGNQLSGVDRIKEMGFTILEVIPDREIILGLVGQFWRPKGNIQPVSAEEFSDFSDPRFAKATWNFSITQMSESTCRVTTETRIATFSPAVRKRFSMYWLLVKPFSGLIRMSMLRQIRKKAEDQR